MQKIIIFLIRKRLGLKKYEKFQFTNQKTRDWYCFTSNSLMKKNRSQNNKPHWVKSGASLNWLLDPECKIKSLGR